MLKMMINTHFVKKQNCLQMSSKKFISPSNSSGRTSMKSLLSRESLTSDLNEGPKELTKEQIEQELLRAFDTQMSFGQKQLPKGISSRCKQKVRSVSVNSASIRRAQGLKPFIHNNQLPSTQIKPQSRMPSSHPSHRSTRSHSSHLSIPKPFHHNKRQSITSQYLLKKQTKNLVQKLLSIKPSQQVSRQKHLQSYSKHLQSKHIMMHRYENTKKGVILVKKTNCCSQHTTVVLKDLNAKKNQQLRQKKFNAIQLKEIELRNMLKDEKKKNRLQTLKKLPAYNLPIATRKKHQRVKTLDTNLLVKRLPISSASSQKSTTQLPKIRTFSKAESYQGRGTFATPTPSGYSFNNRAPGLIKQRVKTII